MGKQFYPSMAGAIRTCYSLMASAIHSIRNSIAGDICSLRSSMACAVLSIGAPLVISVCLFTASILSPQSLHAQSPQTRTYDLIEKDTLPANPAFTPLDEVVITSNKYLRKQSETSKVITVIGREQLERSSGRTLNEVLNTAVGTTIIGSSSNLGTNQTVSIRGATAGNVLILVNGIPVNDPSVITNYFDLNFISIDQVERVEILKGGQSTLYGSDAVAGVINIIMKKPAKEGIHTAISVAGGSYGTIKTNAAITHSSERSILSLRYGYLTTNGFSSANDSTGKADFDKDGFHQHNVAGNWELTLTEKLKAHVFGQYSSYDAGLDGGAFRDERDHEVITDNFQGGGGLTYDLGSGALRFNYRYNNVKRQYLNDSIYGAPNYLKENYAGRTHFLELYGSKKGKHVELLAGLDYRNNEMSLESVSASEWGPYVSKLSDSLAHMSQLSPYVSLILKANKIFNVEIGGRWNHHSVYGNNFSYTINPGALINERVKLFANIYSAFKTPTLYQLFDPFIGNQLLTPEETFSVEGGVQWFINNRMNMRAVYYYRNTDDAIEFIYTDPANFTAMYMNASNRKANGIEVEFTYRDERWNLSANYSYTHGRLQSAYDNTGFPVNKDTVMNNVFRNPNSVMNLTGGIQITKKLYAGATLRIAGARLEPVYGGVPVKMDAYYTADIYGEYRFSSRVKAFADVKNVTDQQYFEILGYNTRGFNVMGGVTVSF